eukprot:SAG11_NODE_1839_length_4184_cov_4.075398_3_plen_149_part_00
MLVNVPKLTYDCYAHVDSQRAKSDKTRNGVRCDVFKSNHFFYESVLFYEPVTLSDNRRGGDRYVSKTEHNNFNCAQAVVDQSYSPSSQDHPLSRLIRSASNRIDAENPGCSPGTLLWLSTVRLAAAAFFVCRGAFARTFFRTLGAVAQ